MGPASASQIHSATDVNSFRQYGSCVVGCSEKFEYARTHKIRLQFLVSYLAVSKLEPTLARFRLLSSDQMQMLAQTHVMHVVQDAELMYRSLDRFDAEKLAQMHVAGPNEADGVIFV